MRREHSILKQRLKLNPLLVRCSTLPSDLIGPAGPEEQDGDKGGGALCFEWGFTRTFPWNQDVAVKFEVKFW